MDLWKSWAYFQKLGCKIQEFFLYFCELLRNRRPELFYPRILSSNTGIFVCTAWAVSWSYLTENQQRCSTSVWSPSTARHPPPRRWTQHIGETLRKMKVGSNACLLSFAGWLPAQWNSVKSFSDHEFPFQTMQRALFWLIKIQEAVSQEHGTQDKTRCLLSLFWTHLLCWCRWSTQTNPFINFRFNQLRFLFLLLLVNSVQEKTHSNC